MSLNQALAKLANLLVQPVLLDNDLPDAPYRFVARFESGLLVCTSELAPAWAEGARQLGCRQSQQSPAS